MLQSVCTFKGTLEVNIIDANANEVLIEYIESPRAFATPHLFKKDNRLPANLNYREICITDSYQRFHIRADKQIP